MVTLSIDAVTASAILINSLAPSANTISRIVHAHNVFTTEVSLGGHKYFSNTTATAPSISVLESANVGVTPQNQVRTTRSVFHAIAASNIQIFHDQHHIMDKGRTVLPCLKLVTKVMAMGASVTKSLEFPLHPAIVHLTTNE